MRKEEITPQSKWPNLVELQSKSQNSYNYNASITGLSLEQRVTRAQHSRISIPLNVLASDLSPATAIVHYLKTHHSLSIAAIARALNRDHRTIWTLLNRNKIPACQPQQSLHQIPLTIFQDRTLSILEHTVKHLHDEGYSLNTIAQLLKRHPSTVSTVHQRARRKHK